MKSLSTKSLILSLLLVNGVDSAVERPEGYLGNDEYPLVNWEFDAGTYKVSGRLLGDLDHYVFSRRVPWKKLILSYAPIGINKETCKLEIPYFDVAVRDMDYLLDVRTNETTGSLGGSLIAMRALKQTHPDMLTMATIGGYERSHGFRTCIQEDKRQTLADSIIDFVKYFAFDGITLDWQDPDCEACGCQLNCIGNNDAGEGDWAIYLEFLQWLKPQLENASESLGRYIWLNLKVNFKPSTLRNEEGYYNPPPFEELCAADSPIDYISLRTMDYFKIEDWAYSAADAPLDDNSNTDIDDNMTISWALDWLKDKCADKTKLLWGLKTDGQMWKTVKKVGSPTVGLWQDTVAAAYKGHGSIGSGRLTYTDINKYRLDTACRYVYDSPSASGTIWCDKSGSDHSIMVTYDESSSFSAKMTRAKAYGMSGAWLTGYLMQAERANNFPEYYASHLKGLIDGWHGTAVYIPPTAAQIVCPKHYIATKVGFPCPFEEECATEGCEPKCNANNSLADDDILIEPSPTDCRSSNTGGLFEDSS